MFNYDRWRFRIRGWLLHFLGRHQSAFDAYLEAAHADPSDPEIARHLASLAAGFRRWEAAESWLEKAVGLAPDDASSWFNLGFVRDQARKSAAAAEAFERATTLDPKLDRAWYGLGLARARSGLHDAASGAFAEAARLQPMNGDAFYQWGMALHHAQRPDELRPVVEKLVGFDPKRARQLVRDAMRPDLETLIPELPF